MLPLAASTLDRLAGLTAPGAPVPPVVDALGQVASAIRAQLPALEQARASAGLIDELARIANSAGQLRDSLAELAQVDGMTSFDHAFAADDASWDAWFAASAAIVRQASSSTTSV